MAIMVIIIIYIIYSSPNQWFLLFCIYGFSYMQWSFPCIYQPLVIHLKFKSTTEHKYPLIQGRNSISPVLLKESNVLFMFPYEYGSILFKSVSCAKFPELTHLITESSQRQKEQACGCHEGWMAWEFGTSRCQLHCTGRIHNAVLMERAESDIQDPVISHQWKRVWKRMHICL